MNGPQEEAYSTSAGDATAGQGPERTLAALTVPPGRSFATTWWGHAWLKALEDTALHLAQLKVGRRLARAGAVGAVSVRPGRLTAVVRDRDGTSHRSDVLLQLLGEAEWDRFLTMAAEQSGHVAALLDHEMPSLLVEDAAGAGVELLPGVGDLEPRCDCEAWDHCGHTAALCYQVARLLDQDPFLLLLVRGRGERELLAELGARGTVAAGRHARSADASLPSAGPAGVDAEDAWAMGGILPPLPPPPPPAAAPGTPPPLRTDAEPPAGIDAEALAFLAGRAAATAHGLLAAATDPGHPDRPPVGPLSTGQDAVRLTVTPAGGRQGPAPHIVSRLAAGTGRDPEELLLAARAWEQRGAEALEVFEQSWAPSHEEAARARETLEAAWGEGAVPELHAELNRWTTPDGRAQVRLDRAGNWWPYRRENGRWAPAGPNAPDPAQALALALEDVPPGQD